MKEAILHKLKVFAWGLLGAGVLAAITFLGENLDLLQQVLEGSLNLDPAIVVLIVGVITNITAQLTKFINQKFSLEEKIGGVVRRLRGRT